MLHLPSTSLIMIRFASPVIMPIESNYFNKGGKYGLQLAERERERTYNTCNYVQRLSLNVRFLYGKKLRERQI